MREVGGYEQLMKLPMSAYDVIAESITLEKLKEKEESEKVARRSKHH